MDGMGWDGRILENRHTSLTGSKTEREPEARAQATRSSPQEESDFMDFFLGGRVDQTLMMMDFYFSFCGRAPLPYLRPSRAEAEQSKQIRS